MKRRCLSAVDDSSREILTKLWSILANISANYSFASSMEQTSHRKVFAVSYIGPNLIDNQRTSNYSHIRS